MNEKTTSLIADLTQALVRLQEILLESPNDIVRDATIQRFEFTFELSWKLMQSILQDNRIESFGAKSVIRGSAQLGIISDPTPWFVYLDARNRTSHIYNAEQAEEIYQKIKSFPPLVEELIGKVKEL
jgi:nucleotidyltransferase substrate binding protein (TIGR01987 family)